MPSRKNEIEPCHYCGEVFGLPSATYIRQSARGIKSSEKRKKYFWVHCDSCGADGPIKQTKTAAIGLWNFVSKMVNNPFALWEQVIISAKLKKLRRAK
jgi:hypothetical protein